MRANLYLYKIMTCLCLGFLFIPSLWGQVKLPHLVSDGMILQREAPIKIWGWASSNEGVVVNFKNKDYKTKADAKGEWQITLPSQKAGGPYQIKVNEINIKDILFGDVWVCSGQSNMDLPIKRVLDLYKKEVEKENNPNIRLFRVSTKYDFEQPQSDVAGGKWKSVTPENILEFSATAYFFGKDLYDKYNVPIGLINPSQGGTPIESWVSEDVIKKYPNNFEKYKLCATPGYIDSITQREKLVSKEWDRTLDQKDRGTNEWYKENIETTDWNVMTLPGYWADKGLGQKNGAFWFRKDIEITESMLGEDATLRLGCIVDSDSTFVNGVFVGRTTYQYPPRVYKIPASLLKKGKNNITVKVINSSGRGGFVHDKLYKLIVGDSEIDLIGDWKYKMGAEMERKASQTTFQNNPVGLYNAMIHPILSYKIKGIIWYQGESNVGRAKEYKSLMADMIQDWRAKWEIPELPFLYVQLPNYMKVQEEPVQKSGWPEMREVQRQTLDIPNTGMAITIDVGEWNDIHPLNKKDVGHRLALVAQKVAYGEKNIVYSGPLFESSEVKDNKVILTFTAEGTGLTSNGDLRGFAIAGVDEKYVWANAKITGKNQITVWSDLIDMKEPVTVKYAWSNNPDKANLRNKEGLPASPFTTQEYK